MAIDTIPHGSGDDVKPNIVVVGGSYVGSKVVDDLIPLVHETHNIVLVEKSSHFKNIFAFPRLHAVSGFESKAFIPYTSEYFDEAYATLSPHKTHCCTHIITGLVTSILSAEVILEDGRIIPYEYLVIATGTGQRTTLGLHNSNIVNRLVHIHEWQADMKRANKIVVIGGGAYGVQLVTDIKTYKSTLSKNVTLVHSRAKLLHTFHHGLHDIAMEKMKEIGVDTILGQRAIRIEEVEGMFDDSNKTLGVTRKTPEFIVHLSGGEQLRADLVITCLGGTPLSDPLRALAPAAVDPETGYIRVLPTLQIASPNDHNATSNSSYTAYPNVFALGDVAHTGAHKAARPGHFQSGVVTRNIQRLIKAKAAQRGAHDVLESYVPPEAPGIHLRLGMVNSLIFRNPALESDVPYVQWDDRDSATFDCGCERYWKKRAETLWRNGDFEA
ncbi:FAD/NAD-P-binding domain-containing protein [Lentinula edodes]|nr:FAD/NAD-P-binding domain-containing protein [Lentinula edodes]